MGRTKEEAPKAYSLRVTENALQNLDNITGYFAYIRHEPLNAISVGDEILKTIDRIEKNPLAFRECEKITTKNKIYRKAVCQGWDIFKNGVTSEPLAESTVSNFFSMSKISEDDIPEAIENGHPVMANLITGSETVKDAEGNTKTINIYHNVVIIGYNAKDGTYIAMDPLTGTYVRINCSKFDFGDPNTYFFEVSGIKPEN